MRVLVTLSFFDPSGEGRLVAVDFERATQETRIAFVPPEPLRVPEKGFTGAAWAGAPGASPLYVCGACAVYRVNPSGWSIAETWHQPCWNDLHHVAVTGDRVLVVNTGLETVDVLTRDGVFLGSHALHPGWLSAARMAGFSPPREAHPALLDARFPRGALPETATGAGSATPDAYYSPPDSRLPFAHRKVRDHAHANHVSAHEGQILVTRFLDRAVDDLATFRRVISDTPGLPHDGLVDGDRFWMTCVNGLIVAYAIEGGRVTGREVERLDVFATGHTGWCRGLAVTPDLLVVGLTAIRRMPRHRWCDRPFEGTETSVLCLERATGRLLARATLDREGRHAKVFSILRC